jgi:hypothetical protein
VHRQIWAIKELILLVPTEYSQFKPSNLWPGIAGEGVVQITFKIIF